MDSSIFVVLIKYSLSKAQAFFMLNSTEHKFQLLIKQKYSQMKKFLALCLSNAEFIMLMNVKMPTIVGILTFMSRISFVLS